MKTKRSISVLGLLTAAVITVFVLTGCGKSEVLVTESGGSMITMEARNAAADSTGTGTLTLEEGQKVVVQADLTGSAGVRVEMFPAGEDDASEPVFNAIMTGKDGSSYTYVAGEYTFHFTAEKGATGSITVRTAEA